VLSCSSDFWPSGRGASPEESAFSAFSAFSAWSSLWVSSESGLLAELRASSFSSDPVAPLRRSSPSVPACSPRSEI
jgi:hypothetical protein